MRRRNLTASIVVVGIALAAIAKMRAGESPRNDAAPLGSAVSPASGLAVAPKSDERALPPPPNAHEPPVSGPATGRSTSEAVTAALGGDDDNAKIDTIEAAVVARDTSSLPTLLAIDLAREPEAAPTIIHAVANLANAADPQARRASVAVLGRWLTEESSRHDSDAEGNVPNLVEALAIVGGSDATAALIGALEKGQLDLSVETLVVQSLGHGGDARALEPVKRFVDRISAIPPVDGIREELRVEALAAGNSAISSIQGG